MLFILSNNILKVKMIKDDVSLAVKFKIRHHPCLITALTYMILDFSCLVSFSNFLEKFGNVFYILERWLIPVVGKSLPVSVWPLK